MSRVASGVLVALLLSAGGVRAATRNGDRDGRTSQRGVLDLGGLFPFTGPSGGHGWGVVPAAMLALAHVNENPNILRSHTLKMTHYDTKVGA